MRDLHCYCHYFPRSSKKEVDYDENKVNVKEAIGGLLELILRMDSTTSI